MGFVSVQLALDSLGRSGPLGLPASHGCLGRAQGPQPHSYPRRASGRSGSGRAESGNTGHLRPWAHGVCTAEPGNPGQRVRDGRRWGRGRKGEVVFFQAQYSLRTHASSSLLPSAQRQPPCSLSGRRCGGSLAAPQPGWLPAFIRELLFPREALLACPSVLSQMPPVQ